MSAALPPLTRSSADPRVPGAALWCGDDVAIDYDYFKPVDLEAAIVALRAAGGSARIVAGGQSFCRR